MCSESVRASPADSASTTTAITLPRSPADRFSPTAWLSVRVRAARSVRSSHGNSANLIHRAAEVHLKEHRRLILVPRETPLSLTQIQNMKLAPEAGAIILPATPGFYHGVKLISDLVDFVVSRICDQLGIPNSLIQRWGTESSE